MLITCSSVAACVRAISGLPDKYRLFPYLLALVQSVFGMALVPQKIAMLVCYAVAVFAPTFATKNGERRWIFGIAVTLVPNTVLMR